MVTGESTTDRVAIKEEYELLLNVFQQINPPFFVAKAVESLCKKSLDSKDLRLAVYFINKQLELFDPRNKQTKNKDDERGQLREMSADIHRRFDALGGLRRELAKLEKEYSGE